MKKKLINMSNRTWSFTLNNYTESDYKIIEDWDKKYLCMGKEVGENGTPHLQGWITFNRTYRLPQLKKLHERIHWEEGKTTDGMNYCMKEGEYIIQDNRNQGKRTDISDALTTLVNDGVKACIIKHPRAFVKYHQGLQKAALYLMPKRMEPPIVAWRYGPTGVGKSRYVWDKHDYNVFAPKNFQWWDGYEQQEAVLFDDFRGEIKFNDLLQFLDRYPYKIEIKGGMMEFNSKYIYFTSSKRPEELYHNCGDKIDQLLRRINFVTEVTLGNTNPVTSENYDLNIYDFNE